MRITVSVRDELAEEIKKLARDRKRSVSSLVAEAVEEYVQRVKRREAGKRFLELSEKVEVSSDALTELEKLRDEDRF